MFLLSSCWERVAPTFFSTGFRRGITVPNHPDDRYDHTQNHLHVKPFLSKEEESHDQNKDCFHVAKNLEWNSCESAYADKLAKIGSHSNGAWQNYENLWNQPQMGMCSAKPSSWTIKQKEKQNEVYKSIRLGMILKSEKSLFSLLKITHF